MTENDSTNSENEKRFTYGIRKGTTVYEIQDKYRKFPFIEPYYYESSAKKVSEFLNKQDGVIQLHEERIVILSELLDLADMIIDLSDDDKAKEFWEKRSREAEKKWEELIK